MGRHRTTFQESAALDAVSANIMSCDTKHYPSLPHLSLQQLTPEPPSLSWGLWMETAMRRLLCCPRRSLQRSPKRGQSGQAGQSAVAAAGLADRHG